jgi:hypothetical protein
VNNPKAFKQACFWAAAYCFCVAVGLAVLAELRWLPGHSLSQFTPFLAHLCLMSVILCGIAMLPEREHTKASLVGLELGVVFILLSFISLFLGVEALTRMTARNAPALLLVPPVLTFFVAVFSSGRLRGGEKPRAEQPEPTTRSEPGPVSIGSIVWSALTATVANAVYFAVAIAVAFAQLFVGIIWGFGIWIVLGGARFNSIKPFVVGLHYIARPPILQVLIAFAVFLLLLRLLGDMIPTWASVFTYIRLSHASEAQRDLVQTRFRALWDYANGPRPIRPRSLAADLAILVIPFVIVVCALSLVFENEELATWLFPPSLHGAGWYLVERNAGFEMMLLFLGSLLIAGSIYRLTIDLWPAAFEGAIISPLRRGTLDAPRFRSFLRTLLRDVRKGAISSELPFDPRTYLSARRLGRNRIFYTLSFVVFLLSLLFAWRGLASYTLIDEHGFESVQFFTGQHVVHGYQDATKVLRYCDWQKGNLSYDVVFRDRDLVDVFLKGDGIGKKLPALLHVDQNLRRGRAIFVPVVSAQPTLSGPACVHLLAQRDRGTDALGLTQIMHP